MRGEYYWEKRLARRRLGSPPHAWGIRTPSSSFSTCPRITPTCVGNTSLRKTGLIQMWDHPHMRGEYLLKTIQKMITKGSPPHAWGILDLFNAQEGEHRITPTCVGNTLKKPCYISILILQSHQF